MWGAAEGPAGNTVTAPDFRKAPARKPQRRHAEAIGQPVWPPGLAFEKVASPLPRNCGCKDEGLSSRVKVTGDPFGFGSLPREAQQEGRKGDAEE